MDSISFGAAAQLHVICHHDAIQCHRNYVAGYRSTMAEAATLVKFGSEEHMVALRDRGLLYMNNLAYFWTIEDECLRGDRFDGMETIERGNHGTISLERNQAIDIPLRLTSWTIGIAPAESERINVFCMYALRPAAGSFPVDERNFRFGRYALVLLDAEEFLRRVHCRLVESQIDHRGDLVKYVDDNYAGELGPFRKLGKYGYQSEWRLVTYKGPGCNRVVEIGSIADISRLIETAEINRIVTLSPQQKPSEPR